MQGSRGLEALLCLLGSSPPSEWREEFYVKTPLFTTERIGGKVFLAPRSAKAEIILDSLSHTLGLKKKRRHDLGLNNNEPLYVAWRGYVIKSLRVFDWFVRRSWRCRDFAVLWAVVYTLNAQGWRDKGVPLDSVAELAYGKPEECFECMKRLFGLEPSRGRDGRPPQYFITKREVYNALNGILSKIPTRTEELIMNRFCTGMGASINEAYEQLMHQGIGVGAVYKTVERLKRDNYVYVMRHVRVNVTGPMREYLSANCRNWFYGYTSEERCFQDAFRRLEETIHSLYRKKLQDEDRASLYRSMRLIPYGSRVIRGALEALLLTHQFKMMVKEGHILSLLMKLEEHYGLGLPLKLLMNQSKFE